MTRGLKLLIEHIYTPTFRVNINIPYVNYFSKLDDSDRYSTITMPFVLPAFQEVFELDNSEINDYELVEVSVGQDTRAEAAWLHGVQTSAAGLPESTLVPGEGNAFTVYLREARLRRRSIV